MSVSQQTVVTFASWFSRVALMLAGLTLTPVCFASTTFESWHTGNGVKVLYYQSDALPMLDLRLVFAAGSARDGDHPGVADLTSATLTGGAGGLDAKNIAEKLEGAGARLEAGSLRDMAWITLRTLTLPDMLHTSVDLMSQIAGKPDFPETELSLMRDQLLTGLKNDEQNPGDIASKAFFKAAYGNHPYAYSPTAEDYNNLTREQVIAFQQTFYVGKNATLAIVGDLDRKQAEVIASQVTQHLKAGEKAPALPDVIPLEKSETIVIDYPSVQSHLLIGAPSVKRGEAMQMPFYIANHSFGGSGFASILMDEVREKRGYAYSVYSYASPMEARGPFIIGLQTRNDQVQQALDVVMDNLEKYAANGPTPAQFDDSIKNITGGAPLKVNTNAKIAQYATVIGFYDLPLDYLDTFNQRVESYSREDVSTAFRRTVIPEKLVTVVVGGGEK